MPITNILFLDWMFSNCQVFLHLQVSSQRYEIISACNALPGVEGQALKWIMTLVAGMTAFYMSVSTT